MNRPACREDRPHRRSVAAWLAGSRPRTLPAAVVPVVVGTAVGWSAHRPGGLLIWRASGALVVALAIQIGTNYHNDYADGLKGTDDSRVGPARLVASGAAAPGAVKAAALASFAVAAAAGVGLAAVTTWWLVALGAVCFAAGWLYTGGPRPYGYLGLGELFVFGFFGVVATTGSAFVQGVTVASGGMGLALLASVPVGLLATALLEANNLRDVAGDASAGKRTLAVRLGRRRASWLYVGCIAGAAAGSIVLAPWRPWVLLTLLALPLAVRPVRGVLDGAEGKRLLPVLGATGRIQIVMGVLLAIGVIL
ncbi:MAG: 1,4-dihydroxy-2-naphthoate polyprenyltransferase [Acidimicrobiales bacterium]